MSSRARRARMVAVAAFVALLSAAAGCRDASRIDADRLVEDLPAALIPDHPEVVTDVVCPQPIERGAGVVTVCAAKLGGTPVAVTVTQLDDDGAVRAEVADPLLDREKVAADLAARFTRDVGIPTSVECEGAAVQVFEVGLTLACTASDPSGRSRVFDVEILDETGALDVRIR